MLGMYLSHPVTRKFNILGSAHVKTGQAATTKSCFLVFFLRFLPPFQAQSLRCPPWKKKIPFRTQGSYGREWGMEPRAGIRSRNHLLHLQLPLSTWMWIHHLLLFVHWHRTKEFLPTACVLPCCGRFLQCSWMDSQLGVHGREPHCVQGPGGLQIISLSVQLLVDCFYCYGNALQVCERLLSHLLFYPHKQNYQLFGCHNLHKTIGLHTLNLHTLGKWSFLNDQTSRNVIIICWGGWAQFLWSSTHSSKGPCSMVPTGQLYGSEPNLTPPPSFIMMHFTIGSSHSLVFDSNSCWYEDTQSFWNFFFIGLVILTILYCCTVYAFVTYRYCKALNLRGMYSTEHGM